MNRNHVCRALLFRELEAALIEYVERYGATEGARCSHCDYDSG